MLADLIETFIIQTLWDGVCYWTGVHLARLATSGRYPPHPVPDRLKTRLEVLGLLVLVGAFIGIVGLVSLLT